MDSEQSEQMQELREQNVLMLEENKRLVEMCQWILKAQQRSEDKSGKARENDYREALPETVELLQSGGFRTAYMDLMDQYQREFLNSKPEEKESRETSYLKSQVLQALLLKLDYQKKVVTNANIDKEKALKAV